MKSKQQEKPKILNDLTNESSNQCIDKLLDVLADVDCIENNEIRKRIRKIAYAITRAVDREEYT